MKKENENREKILNLRLTVAEYAALQIAFKKTTQRKFSDFARAMLLGKPMIAGHRDLSMDAIIIEFSSLRKDMNGIANNINQLVHRLHVLDDPRYVKPWQQRYELEHQKLFGSMEAIRHQVNKIAAKWLL